ncbi:MAG: tRNA (adenosine(37)-N6)-dimethylallyltransferase MiaA [Acidobacteriota bacterium]
MSELVVIVGPTAAGKTSLGAEVGERIGGEVVSADAFAVYRGLDIGTAKPAVDVRKRVAHHLIDVADPRRRYSAGEFVRAADEAIVEIRARGRVPIVVGGTLFYVRALLWGLFPEPPKDPALREELQEAWRSDPDGVRGRLAGLDPDASSRIDPRDRQRILRALEVTLLAGRPMSELWRQHPIDTPRHRACLLGLSPPRSILRARIAQRMDSMFAAGLVSEVRSLLEDGVRPDAHALKAIGYRECCRVISGEWTEAQARESAERATRQLAKRQMTWLRHERGVEWLAWEGESALAQVLARVEARGGTGTRQV